jgi:hypothetical protein
MVAMNPATAYVTPAVGYGEDLLPISWRTGLAPASFLPELLDQYAATAAKLLKTDTQLIG